jgi:hypothetical protein
MSAFSNYLEDQITGWIAGTTFATAPTATFVQLYSQDPTDAGSATGALYSRVSIASGTGSWTRGTGNAGTITNASAITITSSATATASATYVALFSSATGGDLLFYGQLTPTAGKSIAVGDEVKFNASALTLTVA